MKIYAKFRFSDESTLLSLKIKLKAKDAEFYDGLIKILNKFFAQKAKTSKPKLASRTVPQGRPFYCNFSIFRLNCTLLEFQINKVSLRLF